MKSLIHSACCVACLSALSSTAVAEKPDATSVPSPPQEYSAQFDREDWTTTVEAAQLLVTTARRNADEEPLELAEALSMLGHAQLRAADHTNAESTFREALKLIEQQGTRAVPKSANALRGLGFTLAATGRHEEAVPVLDRALLIARRANGLFHIGQQPLLRQLASSLARSGQMQEADRHVKYMLRVGERTYGKNDPRMVPLMCLVGSWQSDTGDFDEARRTFRDALRLVEEQLGENDVAMVEPLRGFARTYTQELAFKANGLVDAREEESESVPAPRRLENPRYISTEGQRALERAVAILDADPNGSAPLLLETLIDIGDWFQIKQDFERALPHYRRAAQVFSTLPKKDQNPFAFPVRLYYPVPGVVIRSHKLAPQQSEEVYVELELTVSAEGLVEAAAIVDESSSSRQAREVLQAMRDARFRPRFANGEPVETVAMKFREVFGVRKRDDQDESAEEETPS